MSRYTFLVNDPATVLQLPGNVAIAITTKLLGTSFFNVSYHCRIFKEFSIPVDTMGAWPDTFLQPMFYNNNCLALPMTIEEALWWLCLY